VEGGGRGIRNEGRGTRDERDEGGGRKTGPHLLVDPLVIVRKEGTKAQERGTRGTREEGRRTREARREGREGGRRGTQDRA
jgi:hypothetical protein